MAVRDCHIWEEWEKRGRGEKGKGRKGEGEKGGLRDEETERLRDEGTA